MMRKKDMQVYLFSVVCIAVNLLGKFVARKFGLPLWLDSLGTVCMAYFYGPVCGVIVGGSVNILDAILLGGHVCYGLTSVAIAVTVGICAKKGFFKDTFGTLSVAFLVTILSVVVSTPLNFLYSDGKIENVWGDSVAAFLTEAGWNKTISVIIGQIYLEFLDKVITMLLLFWGIRLFMNRKKEEVRRKKRVAMQLLACVLITAVPVTVNATEADRSSEEEAQPDFRRYVQTIYNSENGLTGGGANDIAQTKDGVLWIGTYDGLYRYNGSQFQRMKEFETVKTVNCMYTDEAGRLWLGTNDDGLSICINETISNVLRREDGLPSNSIRCITESSEGLYYVGTTNSMVILSLNGGLKVKKEIQKVVYAESVCSGPEGLVATVTSEGDFYLIRGTDIFLSKTFQQEGKTYNCCFFDESGMLYLSTSSNQIEKYEIQGDQLQLLSTISCGTLTGINSICQSEDGLILICADNGAGYLNEQEEFLPLDMGNFNSSIDHVLCDYQSNLWFTSSRLGLMRLCPSAFSEVSQEASLEEQVVNTIASWKDCLYIGTDSGLDVIGSDGKGITDSPLAEELEGVRIRCLKVDSLQHLWICTSDRGVWEIFPDGNIQVYDSTNGATGEKFRSMIEMKDGTVVVSGDSGLTFIRNHKVFDTIGFSDGLANPRILSLYEKEDGTLLAGSDGNGIAVIRNHKVIDTLKKEDGLSSEVILRMVGDADGSGLFLVVGNGICYMDAEGEIRLLDQFPYFNNYDLVDTGNGKLFVLGSAGIYVVSKEELLKGKEVSYVLLDSTSGLRMELTPNSWNYLDDTNNLYMSGGRGVMRLNLDQYDVTERSYRMLMKSIVVDGETIPVKKGRPIHISRGAKRIEIYPEIVNFSINNPNIRVYLEGFDKDAYVMKQSEMKSFIYTNLPAGNYTLRFAVLDGRHNSVFTEKTYQIIKDREFYDYWWFKLYLAIVTVMIISYLTWLFFRTQLQKTLKMQKMELELTKKQLQMGNETIMTIAQAVDAKDENTSQHSVRVSEYAVKIAERLGYTTEQCDDLKKIAMLHDIGKIGIPDRVLNKPAKLTDEEYATMKSHVEIGAEILKNFTWIDHVADGALYHHERYDGRGYVHGLKGEEIPLNARIIGIADAFDAMTANRVYRKKLDIGYVLEELKKGKGTQFDPKLVDILFALIEDGTIDVKRMYDASGSKEQMNS